MRFLTILQSSSVPEWQRCYYDYYNCKIIISVAKRALLIRQRLIQFQFGISYQAEIQVLNYQVNKNKSKILIAQLYSLVQEGNILFFHYHALNKTIVFLFCQMKIHELSKRLDTYQKWLPKVQNSLQSYLNLLSNVFYQGKLLQKMIQINKQADQKIYKKHKKIFQRFQFDTPFFRQNRLSRITDQLKTYFNHLESIYLLKKQVYPKKARSQLYRQLQSNPLQESIASYLFGLTNGISVSLIILIIVLLTYNHIYITTNDTLRRDFPVWRGLSYMIIYCWVLSLNIVLFEKQRINYQLIFGFKKLTSQSAYVLAIASLMTFIYLTLFILYLLNLSGIVIFKPHNITNYFPLVLLAFVVGYLFFPLPIFNYKRRLFILKSLFETIISPFVGVNFYTIWIIQQYITMIQPFSDLFYTVCFYTKLDFNIADVNQNSCLYLLTTGQIFGMVVFTYRLIASIWMATKQSNFIHGKQKFIIIRCCLNIFCLLVSYLSTFYSNLLYVWIGILLPLILYNYYVDLTYDWGLLQGDYYHPLLRQNRAFKPQQYYIIMSWVMTLSESIIYSFNFQTYYLIFAAGVIENLRKFAWNVIRVQKQHLINCQDFRVKTDYKQKQRQVRKQIYDEEFRQDIQTYKGLVLQRYQAQIINLKYHLQNKLDDLDDIVRFHQQKMKRLYEIEIEVDKMYTYN